ncbi:conserved virulence factor C family protein [Bacillus badius]|uniref:conserved virulence factor C family protein n=1 Tax=Bacillus badius TaxID=1455 RepID=UPI000596F7B3|nr:conserved virulence factor C family protein [Bacillus badius]MED4714978.1 conserved virulence factor C family protein [Bacillus badius]
MRIVKIEPTPSPNTMKVILDEELPAGKSNNYKAGVSEEAPEQIQSILAIEGVKGVYHVADFLAIERNGKYDWQSLLPQVRAVFGEAAGGEEKAAAATDSYGEVQASIQTFKGIPIQLKLTSSTEEKRFPLPDYFLEAFKKAQLAEDNYVLQRKWEEFGIRYGDLDEMGKETVEEIVAAYPRERLEALAEDGAQGKPEREIKRRSLKLTASMWQEEADWRKRYQWLEQMEAPSEGDLPVLQLALSDSKPAIRRLAVVYIGMIEDKKVLPLLYEGLNDPTVTVRRTAGDCLSDLGFEEAIPAMCKALEDKSKIVRWRAAMFLYEVGDETALPALKQAENDQEFEVQMQVKMAIERIEGGEEAKGSVWKQMTESREK